MGGPWDCSGGAGAERIAQEINFGHKSPAVDWHVTYWPLVGANGKAASDGPGAETFFNLTCLMSTYSFSENSIMLAKAMSRPSV